MITMAERDAGGAPEGAPPGPKRVVEGERHRLLSGMSQPLRRMITALLLCLPALAACAAREEAPRADFSSIPMCQDSAIGIVVPAAFEDETSFSRYHSQLVALGWLPDADTRKVAPVVTDLPRLLNFQVAARALMGAYPAQLRDQGIGGTVRLWFMLDADGNVSHAEVKAGSGYWEMDLAAVRAVKSFVFSPALRDGCRLQHSFSSVPVRFEVR
jgi:TonB family protein